MSSQDADRIRGSIRRHTRLGLALVIAVIAGLGGWAAATEISGAVIAPGQVVVASNVKKVQHPNGGIVAALNVRDGDTVAEGQIVVRVDDTITRANFAIVAKGLDELEARKARLEAERDGAATITFPDELTRRASDLVIGRILSGETKLLERREAARDGQRQQLTQRIGQLREEISGLSIQVEAKGKEVVLITRELDATRALWKRNLVPLTKITALEREATRTEGEHGQFLASIAQAKGKISETELQIAQIDRDLASDVAKELAEVEAKIGELVERKVAAEDQLKRVDIRAPQSGRVHQLAVHPSAAW